jgi:SnoaL-like domain
MTREAARRWATTWGRAWVGRNVAAIEALYRADAVFSSQPFRRHLHGRAGVRTYVGGAFADETDIQAWFGEPLVDGDRAAVEWWAALTEDGRPITLAGTSVLRFDHEGLVVEQRDTWNQVDGRHEPPAGWGR